ncbi:J domain-containing protein [Rhizobium sp. SAFR-030]|uniref:J domain-containing protein n=1 Tax=Rhizobium sp. SAFR-030 TaxID=3387277 RepID=UPI003F7F1FED
MRDPYSVLGVKRDAAVDEIKAAWRSKAKSLHPDHNQDDPSANRRFAEVGQAYEVLKDPDRRRRYDRAAEAHQTIMQQREGARQAEERAKAARAKAEQVMEELARANAQRAQAQAAAAAEAPEDIVERIFGQTAEAASGGGRRARPTSAQQAHYQTQSRASQEQAAPGQAQPGSRTTAPDGDTADTATTGDEAPAAKPSAPLPLQAIELITSLMRRIRGEVPPPEKAPDLLASANVSLEDMLKLNIVTLHLSDEREIRFPLEAGMTDGEEVRLKGQGLRLAGMQRGDLLVTVRIGRDERFRVEGHDLHTALSISLEDAVLGGEHEVETPGGRMTISVPAWSGSDQYVTVPGLGLLKKDGERGDLIVELRVLLWEKPDAKVIDLMRHMRHGLFV